ncbi:hypothetical protein MP638_001248, partial [Amoeboaphelidium occidentale]
MSEMPTKEGLHSLFTHYGMKEKADLLKETPDSFVWMKLLPEQEWMKIAGKDSGSVIYNYLHPKLPEGPAPMDINGSATNTVAVPLEANVFLGNEYSPEGTDGINLSDKRILKRNETVQTIIERLDEVHALMIKSPPMSGKTSLASLIASYVTDFHRAKGLKSFVINTSTVDLKLKNQNWDLSERLKFHFGVDFDRLDEISRSHKLAKQLKTNGKINIRLLLFSAYGSSPQNAALCTPVEFTGKSVIGIKDVLLKDEEITHYIENYCHNHSLVKSSDAFFACVKSITGGHVGLASVLVDKLNDKLSSLNKRNGATEEE